MLAVCVALGVAACGGDDDDGPETFATLSPDPSYPGSPGDPGAYASLFDYDPVAGCNVPNPANLEGETELRIFRGSGVPERDLLDFLGGLARYYDQYGVSMFTRYEVIDVPVASAMTFDLDAIAAHVERETGINPNRPSSDLTAQEMAEVERAIGRAVLHNVRELIRVYGTPRRNIVNVVILDSMVGDNLPRELIELRGIAGLGLSPELLATITEDDPSIALYDWLDLHQEFTPIAIVGTDVVKQVLSHPDIVMAHEVGHAYGLVHVDADDNLLHQGATDCTLMLDDDQLARVRVATGAVAHVPGVESLSLTTRAGEFVHSIRQLARGLHLR